MKKDLFLEEAVLDDLSQNFSSLEQPLSRKAFRLLFVGVMIVVAVVGIRLFFLGWWQGDFYEKKALANSGEMTVIRAQRGVVFDRFKNPLVKNLPAFHVNLKLVEFLKSGEDKTKTIGILQDALNLSPGHIEDLLKSVNLEKQNTVTIIRHLTVDQVIKIKNLNLPAVQIEDDFKRHYFEGEIFSHILGYIGSASKVDLEKNKLFLLNDLVGKNGLELFYDTELRGEDGEIISYRNAKGEIIENKLFKKSKQGHEIYTTIDLEFQSFFYKRIKQGLEQLGSRAGVGIALNSQTGEILALVNLPSFDNNKIKSEDLVNPLRPLFNRAVSGVYSPGSTMKPLVAFAALKEGIISPEKEILSTGYIEIPNPYYPDRPSRFVDWKPHGWVDIYSAIARSSNVYFYEIGGGFGSQKGLGIKNLKKYWQEFGFGELTGLDLPSEAIGFLPDPEIKEKKQEGVWRIGDTYNVSIGQGDLSVTPIQLINYIAAIANGGKIYQPFIVKKIISENGEIVKEINSKIMKDYSSDIEIIKKVQKGMVDAVEKPYGTAHLLADLPISVAGKTGSSQIENKTKTNAFFVGYTPVEPSVNESQIAILVLVEDAREGSINTIPIVKDVLKWYSENRIKNNADKGASVE